MELYDFDAIVLDLDGVLIDSRPQMEFVFRECYLRFGPGGEPPVREFFQRMGMPLPDILKELRLPEEMAPRYRELSRQLHKQIRLVTGAHSTLNLLRGTGLPLGLMTGKDRARTLEILTHFGLKHFFSGIVCGDDPYPGKPSPEGLWALAKMFGVESHRVVIVGDSLLDVRCGLAAGAVTIAATWGFESPDTMADSGAHVCCSSFHELESWIFECRKSFHPDTDLAFEEVEAD